MAVFGSPFSGLQLYEYQGTYINGAFRTAGVVLAMDVAVGVWVPLVAGAAIVQVNNTSAAPVNATVAFEIDS